MSLPECELDPLEQYLAVNQGREFRFGQWDCLHFAVIGWAGVHMPVYAGEREALRVMARLGARRLMDMVDRAMQATDRPKRGDVVAIASAPFDAMGICLGREAVFLHHDAYRIVSMRKTARAWSV